MGWEREAAWSPSCDLFVNGSFKGNHTDSEQDIKIELISTCFSWLWFGNKFFEPIYVQYVLFSSTCQSDSF
jgi:hypothetical protein